ncbi:uncharacterized protein ARMOST_01837 [Armillaria ostoyae]|uniref:DUF7330 domain-containing protein n=1 Tax=Armillaria ostoyae TaxID=47428 RepID=A0A284QQ24_ARMOS|nr:uncharacterized protein ARMOST_01837 [Armillaria ostoyae]
MTRKSRPKKSQPAASESQESQALVLASSHDLYSPAEEEPLLAPVVLAPAIVQRSVQPSGSSNIAKTEKKNLAIMPSSSPPPPYGSRSEDTPPPARQPGNFMTIIRDSGPIKQSFLIDPTLSVPSELLPTLTPSEQGAGGTRNNLNLEAKYGEIDADIEVMKSTKLTRIRVDRLPGTVSPGDLNRLGPLCTIDICATSGNIYLLIPKKRLVGKFVATARGDVKFSTTLEKDLSAFNEKGNRRECFIGDCKMWSEGMGDVINLEAKTGTVWVQYNGEPFVKPENGGCIIV